MALEQVFWGIIGVGGGAPSSAFTPTNYALFLTTILTIGLLISTFRIERRLDELIELIIEDSENDDDFDRHPPYDIELPDDEN